MTAFATVSQQGCYARYFLSLAPVGIDIKKQSADEHLCKVTGFRRISSQASSSKSYPCWGSECSVDLKQDCSVTSPESGTKCQCLCPRTLVLMALSLCDLVLDMSSSMFGLFKVENHSKNIEKG